MMRMEIVCAAWALNDVKLHQVVLWTKTRPVLGRLWYMRDYEPCAVGWPEGRQPPKRRHPPASARATWPLGGGMEGEAERPEHPTVKPVELFRRPTEYHTVPGEVVYEPFCGSGTAIIAAEMTGRRCYAIEISAPYCDVAIERWQRFTGLQARRIS
jgi:DNA modification methylase